MTKERFVEILREEGVYLPLIETIWRDRPSDDLSEEKLRDAIRRMTVAQIFSNQNKHLSPAPVSARAEPVATPPQPFSLDDYRHAPSGTGPRAAEWKDKPHRLLYDALLEIERLRAALAEAQREAVMCFACGQELIEANARLGSLPSHKATKAEVVEWLYDHKLNSLATAIAEDYNE